MSVSRKKRSAPSLTSKTSTTKTPHAPMQMSVALTGDQRSAESLILEVRAMAKRYGLEMPSVEVVRQPRVGPKAQLTSTRKSR
jgi:hypothetical protein